MGFTTNESLTAILVIMSTLISTVVTTWDVVEPLLKLGIGTLFAVTAIILLCRMRRSWWRGCSAFLCVGVSFSVFWQFWHEREKEAEAYRRINTQGELMSLNSLLVYIQMSAPDSTDLSDAELIRRLRADDCFEGMIRDRDSGDITDYWNQPLFMTKNANGFRILRSLGPDGHPGSDDDL